MDGERALVFLYLPRGLDLPFAWQAVVPQPSYALLFLSILIKLDITHSPVS